MSVIQPTQGKLSVLKQVPVTGAGAPAGARLRDLWKGLLAYWSAGPPELDGEPDVSRLASVGRELLSEGGIGHRGIGR